MKKICVIGSFNIDVTTSVEKLPKIGESVFSKTFDVFIGGGKGANQAVALGKLGTDVRMVGKLGDQFYGPEYLEVLKKNKVNCEAVVVEKNTFPGSAIVAVDEKGNNLLFVYPGANSKVDVDYIKGKWDIISKCDIFLLQLEIPLETNIYLIKELRRINKTIILDPAPAMKFPDELLGMIDYITPNETELEALTGITAKNEKDIEQSANILLNKGSKTVIVKAGDKGAYVAYDKNFVHIPAIKVNEVDSTAAGDSFNAGFALKLSEGKDIYESIRFANCVGALATMALGGQSSMPTISQVNELFSRENKDVII
jgi:ribokinase